MAMKANAFAQDEWQILSGSPGEDGASYRIPTRLCRRNWSCYTEMCFLIEEQVAPQALESVPCDGEGLDCCFWSPANFNI